jgi:hypothetical protein
MASVHSKASAYDNHPRKQSTASSRLDIQSLANRKLYGSRETLDPFAFIQPVPEPFGRKVRKTCRPIFGMCVMLILAASLGAAIYFAVELKSKNLILKFFSRYCLASYRFALPYLNQAF